MDLTIRAVLAHSVTQLGGVRPSTTSAVATFLASALTPPAAATVFPAAFLSAGSFPSVFFPAAGATGTAATPPSSLGGLVACELAEYPSVELDGGCDA